MAETLVFTVFLDLQGQGGCSLGGAVLFLMLVGTLFFPIPKSLGCTSYVARTTLARKFINNRTLLNSRNVGKQSF